MSVFVTAAKFVQPRFSRGGSYKPIFTTAEINAGDDAATLQPTARTFSGSDIRRALVKLQIDVEDFPEAVEIHYLLDKCITSLGYVKNEDEHETAVVTVLARLCNYGVSRGATHITFRH